LITRASKLHTHRLLPMNIDLLLSIAAESLAVSPFSHIDVISCSRRPDPVSILPGIYFVGSVDTHHVSCIVAVYLYSCTRHLLPSCLSIWSHEKLLSCVYTPHCTIYSARNLNSLAIGANPVAKLPVENFSSSVGHPDIVC